MTDYALVGKKGTGKSKNAVRIMRQCLIDKKAVATNLDLNLEKMFGPFSRSTYVRIPDKPSSFDLLAAGHGNPDSYDEDLNGALVLDELGTWLNTRTFADKGRADVLDFMAHARKHGWDTYYIMQDVAQVDKQVRESFLEFTVRHVALKKVKIPFIGGILSALFGRKAGYLPAMHVAATRLGINPQSLPTERVIFAGKDLEPCYDTRQVFQASYPHGTHSVLSPWHVSGRFLPQPKPVGWAAVKAWIFRAPRSVSSTPLSRPDPAYARVLALSRKLPPDEAVRVVARYSRLTAAR